MVFIKIASFDLKFLEQIENETDDLCHLTDHWCMYHFVDIPEIEFISYYNEIKLTNLIKLTNDTLKTLNKDGYKLFHIKSVTQIYALQKHGYIIIDETNKKETYEKVMNDINKNINKIEEESVDTFTQHRHFMKSFTILCIRLGFYTFLYMIFLYFFFFSFIAFLHCLKFCGKYIDV
tara:strand:- start:173 stop:703 length:531 start_codon:yes stop_codon:yes gene_type:complete